MKRQVTKLKETETDTKEELLETILNENRALAHDIRHIAQSLGIPQEKIIT